MSVKSRVWVRKITEKEIVNEKAKNLMDEGFNCQSNGRLDKDYMKWRWQPQDCDIPRNQWESMLCLLMGGVKDPKKVYEVRGRKITKERGNYCFKFEDYKCTVEFYVSHFLVHESKDKGSSRWRGADILVFNTAHWWSHSKTKAGKITTKKAIESILDSTLQGPFNELYRHGHHGLIRPASGIERSDTGRSAGSSPPTPISADWWRTIGVEAPLQRCHICVASKPKKRQILD
ncbi:protein trichome birefringence-like 6 [Phtheirospermum japonicum]|uniref:Protein trichome birefringence-like 6 n=1 Tax=Phtheirospermum japonicum TaxID=374723 RepID=A0A830D587_9LAMI|nr:protein trichome birefringence-like 6 [Phtheirospermum japonicum]